MVKTPRKGKETSGRESISKISMPEHEQLEFNHTRGIAAPVSSESETVTFRLTGHWLRLWTLLRNSEPKLSPSELFRQAIAMRAVASSLDSEGNKLQLLVRFKNEVGEVVTKDLEEHIGMKTTSTSV
jgi:hypothetical protein